MKIERPMNFVIIIA